MNEKDSRIEAPRGAVSGGIEAPRSQDVQAPRTAPPEAPRVEEQAPVVEKAPAAARSVEPPHSYRIGDRVGLLARVKDVHDKGNLSLEIEGTGGEGGFVAPQYVHISEAALHAGVDMIYITRQRRLAEEGEGRDG